MMESQPKTNTVVHDVAEPGQERGVHGVGHERDTEVNSGDHGHDPNRHVDAEFHQGEGVYGRNEPINLRQHHKECQHLVEGEKQGPGLFVVDTAIDGEGSPQHAQSPRSEGGENNEHPPTHLDLSLDNSFSGEEPEESEVNIPDINLVQRDHDQGNPNRGDEGAVGPVSVLPDTLLDLSCDEVKTGTEPVDEMYSLEIGKFLNKHNTCYLNVVLVLFCIFRRFRMIIMMHKSWGHEHGDCLTCNLKSITNNMMGAACINPEKIREYLRKNFPAKKSPGTCRSSEGYDEGELDHPAKYLQFFLETTNKENWTSNRSREINKLCSGRIEYKCEYCNEVNCINVYIYKISIDEKNDINKCFQQPEILDKCRRCGKEETRPSTFVNFPDLMMVEFDGEANEMWHLKWKKLDLENESGERVGYELEWIVVRVEHTCEDDNCTLDHSEGKRHGHFYCYLRDIDGWVRYNDAKRLLLLPYFGEDWNETPCMGMYTKA